MTDQVSLEPFVDDEKDAVYTALTTIDYAAIAAATEPDQPGGRTVYSSDDYETDEEEDEALEDFFDRILDSVIVEYMRTAHEKA